MTKTPDLIFLPKWPAAVLCAAAMIMPLALNAGPMDKNPVVENLQRPFDWTGFYIGAHIGGALSEQEFNGSGGDTEGHLFSDLDVGQQLFSGFAGEDIVRFVDQVEKDRPNRENYISAIIGGGQIGYQHQFGHFVVGVEGDFDRTAIRDTEQFRVFEPSDVVDETELSITAETFFFGRRTSNTNWMGSARGKFGYATGPLLFYGTGGVAFAQVDVWAHDVANSSFTIIQDLPGGVAGHPDAPAGFGGRQLLHIANTSIEKDSDVMIGWTAGFGLEVAFNDAVTLALEYRHNDFGDETFHFNNHDSNGPIFSGGTNVDFSSDQVTVRMNVLLNHMFGHGAYTANTSPAANNVAAKSPFGGSNEDMQVGYTKAKDASKWSAKDKEVKVEEEFNWTGFYVGAHVGGVWTDYDFSHYEAAVDVGEQFDENEPNFRPADAPAAPTGKGFLSVLAPFSVPSIDGGSDDSMIGGGQFGYQHQFGHFVVGVEGDFSGLSSEKSTDYVSSSFEFIDKTALAQSNLYSERKASVDWTGSARLKLGYACGPVMLYATGGGAWAKVRTWATDTAITDFFVPTIGMVAEGPQPIPIGGFNFSGRSTNNTNDEDVMGGWTAGGGAEWAFSKIASLGVEYRHTEYENADSHYDPHHEPIFANGNHVDIDSDQVTVRVNLLLGHMGPGH